MSCCAPQRNGDVRKSLSGPAPVASGYQDTPLIHIPGGAYRIGNPRGDGYHADGEDPVHEVRINPFLISPTAVTNTEFARFVQATSYVTEAEQFGWSFVFAGLLPPELQELPYPPQTPWWRQVHGATWRHPEGPQSSIDDRADHPVIHVSWNDAQAYCAWSGTRLPTESEWEIAARGGREGAPFPWGHEIEPGGQHMMNVWQGDFPFDNTRADGFLGTAPVDSYRPNGYGLYCMTGNVWEWCADWFHPDAYRHAHGAHNPTGPSQGRGRVMRGGSYLCHHSYCRRYRVDARSSNTPDSSTGNTGFRVARSLP